MTIDKSYAEDVNYWKTSQSGVESILDNAKKEIKAVGGSITGSGMLEQHNLSLVFVAFTLGDDDFRIAFPVLEPRSKSPANETAARRQAASALYHSVKARCVEMKFTGARAAFGGYRLLPTGHTDGETATPELVALLPSPVLLLGGGRRD